MPNLGSEDPSTHEICVEKLTSGLIELVTGAMECEVLCPINEECSRDLTTRKTVDTGSDQQTQ